MEQSNEFTRPTRAHDVADSGSSGPRVDDVRRQGPGDGVRADRAVAPARGCTERVDRAPRRRRVRRVQRVRGPMPDAGGRAARGGWFEVQPFPHDRSVRSNTPGAVDRPQSPLGGDGQHHRDRHVGAGKQLAAAESEGAVGDDDEVERLLDRPVRQMPRGSGVAILADGPVRRVAVGRRWIRDLLRIHRWREQSVGSGVVRGHDARRAAGDAGAGISPDRGSRRPSGGLGAPTKGADARQAVLHLLRAWRDACAASRAQGVGRQVRRSVRRRLGCAARAHLRQAEGVGCHAGRR